MANEISRGIIRKISQKEGPEYDAAVRAGAAYWETVLAGRPNAILKEASDRALSSLIGCRAQVTGRKLSWKENVLRAIHDTITSGNQG